LSFFLQKLLLLHQGRHITELVHSFQLIKFTMIFDIIVHIDSIVKISLVDIFNRAIPVFHEIFQFIVIFLNYVLIKRYLLKLLDELLSVYMVGGYQNVSWIEFFLLKGIQIVQKNAMQFSKIETEVLVLLLWE